MDFSLFIEEIKAALQGPLPGHEAQIIMGSDYYRNLKTDPSKATGYKKSAVCLLFYLKEDKVHFLLIKRPDTHKYHAGQIAMPGGSCDENETYEETALRELYEETGVQISLQNVLGRLSPFYIPVTNFYIQPAVAFINEPFKLVESIEVEKFIEFPLKDLLDESIISETEVVMRAGLKTKTPYFNVQGFVMWGATAMMLSELKELLKQNKTTFSSLFQ
ncbi:MAG: NUDIX hydrolase [Bacteroidia bacterium]